MTSVVTEPVDAELSFDALVRPGGRASRLPRHLRARTSRVSPAVAILLGLLAGGVVAWLLWTAVMAQLGAPAAPQPIDRMPSVSVPPPAPGQLIPDRPRYVSPRSPSILEA